MKITLCGSARFESAFKIWNEVLSLQGHVIYSLAVYPSDKVEGKSWYSDEQKRVMDEVHISKINASDAIFVICGEERYIGESTFKEIVHTIHSLKPVIFEFWPMDKELNKIKEAAGPVMMSLRAACPYTFCPNHLDPSPPCPTCYE